jgi:hypothetical protein
MPLEGAEAQSRVVLGRLRRSPSPRMGLGLIACPSERRLSAIVSGKFAGGADLRHREADLDLETALRLSVSGERRAVGFGDRLLFVQPLRYRAAPVPSCTLYLDLTVPDPDGRGGSGGRSPPTA